MSRLPGVKVEGVEARSRVGISGVSSGGASPKLVGIGLISRLRLASIWHGRYGDGWRRQLSIARYIRRRHNLLVEDLWVSHSSRVSHTVRSSPKDPARKCSQNRPGKAKILIGWPLGRHFQVQAHARAL